MARVLDPGIDEEREGRIDIGVVKDDLRRFIPKLQRDRHHVFGGDRLDKNAGGDRSGEAETMDPGMGRKRGTCFGAKAGYDNKRALGGRLTSSARCAKARAVRLASSAGFRTAALPMVNAAPTDRPMI